MILKQSYLSTNTAIDQVNRNKTNHFDSGAQTAKTKYLTLDI